MTGKKAIKKVSTKNSNAKVAENKKSTTKPTYVRSVWSDSAKDRYFILFSLAGMTPGEKASYNEHKKLPALSVSASYTGKRGVLQYMDVHEGNHLGTKCTWEDLPDAMRKAFDNDPEPLQQARFHRRDREACRAQVERATTAERLSVQEATQGQESCGKRKLVPAKEFEPFWLDDVQSQVMVWLQSHGDVALNDEDLIKLLEDNKYPIEEIITFLTNTGLVAVRDNALHLSTKCLLGGSPWRGTFIGDDTNGKASEWWNNPKTQEQLKEAHSAKLLDEQKKLDASCITSQRLRDTFESNFIFRYKVDAVKLMIDRTDSNNGENVSDTLERIARFLHSNGVESLQHELADNAGYWAGSIAIYISLGDPYKKTIVFDAIEKKFLLASCAEVQEKFEAGKIRAGYRQDDHGVWIAP